TQHRPVYTLPNRYPTALTRSRITGLTPAASKDSTRAATSPRASSGSVLRRRVRRSSSARSAWPSSSRQSASACQVNSSPGSSSNESRKVSSFTVVIHPEQLSPEAWRRFVIPVTNAFAGLRLTQQGPARIVQAQDNPSAAVVLPEKPGAGILLPPRVCPARRGERDGAFDRL